MTPPVVLTIARSDSGGDAVPEAVRNAKRYVVNALLGGRGWRLGAGPGPLDHFGWSV